MRVNHVLRVRVRSSSLALSMARRVAVTAMKLAAWRATVKLSGRGGRSCRAQGRPARTTVPSYGRGDPPTAPGGGAVGSSTDPSKGGACCLSAAARGVLPACLRVKLWFGRCVRRPPSDGSAVIRVVSIVVVICEVAQGRLAYGGTCFCGLRAAGETSSSSRYAMVSSLRRRC